MVVPDLVREAGLVALEQRRQRHAEDVGLGQAGLRAAHHGDGRAAAVVQALAPRIPVLPGRVAARVLRTVQHLPWPAHAVRDGHFVAILQVASDAGNIGPHGNAVGAQLGGRPDAREHEQLRRVERATAQHDFTPGAHLAQLARCRVRDGMGPVEVAALQVFDAAGRAIVIEQDARRERIRLDVQQLGMRALDLPQPLPRADAPSIRRRQRRVAQAGEAAARDGPREARVRVAGAPQPEPGAGQRVLQAGCECGGCQRDQLRDLGVAKIMQRHRLLGAQPAAPAVPGRVDAETPQRAPQRAVVAVLEALGETAHGLRVP